MSKVALAHSLSDWHNLIETGGAIAEYIPEMPEMLAKLAEVLQRTRDLETRRLHLEAERQVITRQIRESKGAGKDLATRIRFSLKAVYGFDNPRLVGYGIKPRPLGRGRAPRKPALPLPPEVE